MNQETFWKIINDCKRGVRGDRRKALAKLRDALRALSDSDLVAYEQIFKNKLNDLYRWDVWAAAYFMQGGCSDDGFMDWRAGLIFEGKEAYDAVSAEPDALADFDVEGFEELLYVAAKVWHEDHPGEDMPIDYSSPRQPAGEPFPEDDPGWFEQRFPRLAERVKTTQQSEMPLDFPQITQVLIRFTADPAVNDELFKAFCDVTKRDWYPETENGELVIRATLYGEALPQLEQALNEVRNRLPAARDCVVAAYDQFSH